MTGSKRERATARRAGVLGVHSLDRFALAVPDLDEAERFYTTFGLDVHRYAGRIDLHTRGNPHRWASVYRHDAPKRLAYLTFGAFEDELDSFRARVAAGGLGCEPHPMGDEGGVWLRDPDGVAIQIVPAPKVSPSVKPRPAPQQAVAPGQGTAPARSAAAPVHPRRLSHVLRFTPDVPRMVAFVCETLGLRLSDRSGDLIAFLHGVHGSDHHMIAFAKSDAPGLHHSSWDVASVDEVGCGAEAMRAHGYTQGWGVGRHVLGSNYFYYARDPWGSYAEYSYDIDFVPANVDWPAADHPPEDSFYLWGPPVPADFVTNHEAAAA